MQSLQETIERNCWANSSSKCDRNFSDIWRQYCNSLRYLKNIGNPKNSINEILMSSMNIKNLGDLKSVQYFVSMASFWCVPQILSKAKVSSAKSAFWKQICAILQSTFIPLCKKNEACHGESRWSNSTIMRDHMLQDWICINSQTWNTKNYHILHILIFQECLFLKLTIIFVISCVPHVCRMCHIGH